MKLEVIRVMDDEGRVVHPEREPKLTGDELRRLFRAITLQRILDDRMMRLQRVGRIGFYLSCIGEEAVVYGTAHALRDEADDRLLVLREIRDLEIAVPPPESISYHDLIYVQRLSGRANIEIAGRVPERAAGSADVWRFRAAGDLFLQIEEGGGRVFMLAGESVHRGMIDVLPGR